MARDGYALVALRCEYSRRDNVEGLEVDYGAVRGASVLSNVYYHPFDPRDDEYWLLFHGLAEAAERTYSMDLALTYNPGRSDTVTYPVEVALRPPKPPQTVARVVRQPEDFVAVTDETGGPLSNVETAWMKPGFIEQETRLFAPEETDVPKRVKAPQLKLSSVGQVFNVIIDQDDIVQVLGITVDALESNPSPPPPLALTIRAIQDAPNPERFVIIAEVSGGSRPYTAQMDIVPSLFAEPELSIKDVAGKSIYQYTAVLQKRTTFTFSVSDVLGNQLDDSLTVEPTPPTENSLVINIVNRMRDKPQANVQVIGVQDSAQYCREARCAYELPEPKSVQLVASVNSDAPYKVTWSRGCRVSVNPKAATVEVRGNAVCDVALDDSTECNPSTMRPEVRIETDGRSAPYADISARRIYFSAVNKPLKFDASRSMGARQPAYLWEFTGFNETPQGEGAVREVQPTAATIGLNVKLRLTESGCAAAPEEYPQLDIWLCICADCNTDLNGDFFPDECAF